MRQLLKKDESLKILHFPDWFPHRENVQLGIFIEKHARAVAQFCISIVIFTIASEKKIKNKYEIVEKKENDFISIIVYYEKSKNRISFFRKIINIIRYFKALSKGKKQQKKHFEKPDIIHFHIFGKNILQVFYYSFILKIPFVLSEHCSIYLKGIYQKRKYFYKKILSWIFKKANATTAVSKVLKNAMQNNNLKNKNFQIVSNIVEIKQQKNIISKEKNDKIKMLSVADLVDDIKNISGIIRAFSKLENKIPNLEYHIIGGGKDFEKLKILSQELNLENKIFFHGLKDNLFVLNYLHEIDFLVLNSNYETFSVVVAEALLCGKPVIATKCGGPEMLLNKENGLLISINNEIELQKAIEYMAGNFSSYQAKKIQEKIKNSFDLSTIGKQFFEIYKKTLETNA